MDPQSKPWPSLSVIEKLEGTKDGQLLNDIFIGRKPRPPDYRSGVIITTLLKQPCWPAT